VLLLCTGSTMPAQRSNPANFLFMTAASADFDSSIGVPSALDRVVGYRELVSQLQSQTKVPLRLPTFVPKDGDKDNPVVAKLETASLDDYQIELRLATECGGVGHLGYIDGSTSALSENTGPKIPVVLNGGIKGYFIDAGCGANCDDAAIYWTDGKYHYSISMKAETKDTLTRMVNSAIASSPK